MKSTNISNKHNVIFARWGISDFEKNFDAVKELRKMYKYYPYLYAYNEEEELDYLSSYLDAKENLDAFVCLDNGRLVGISIGCPLRNDFRICAALYELDIFKDSYYFGDIIISQSHWGSGIADVLYSKHISFVKSKGFKKIAALIVERPERDPRKPAHYRKSKLWEKHNFTKTTYIVNYSWLTWNKYYTISKLEQHKLRAYEKTI